MATAAQIFLDILVTKKVRTWVPTTSQKQSVIRVDYQVWKNFKSHLPTYIALVPSSLMRREPGTEATSYPP